MIAGLIGGLAVSAKYSAAPLAAAVLFVKPRSWPRWSAVAIFLAAFGAGFAAGTPFAVADFASLKADVLFERTHLAAGHGTLDLGPGWLYHLTHSLRYGLGLPLLAAALAGGVPLARRNRHALPVVAFALLFFVVVGSGRTVFFRYVLPLIPIACLSAACFVEWCADALAGSEWGQSRVRAGSALSLRRAIVAIVAGVVALPAVFNCVWLNVLLARTDTRVLAAEWLRTRVNAEATVFDAGNDYTRLDLAGTRFHDWRYDAATGSFAGAEGRLPQWIVLYDSPLTEYTRTDPRLTALSAAQYAPAYRVRGTDTSSAAVFDPQDAFFLPIAGFSGVERPGPGITIYRLSGR